MDKSKKLYLKAIKNYDNGNIERAMDYCNKSLKENRQNSASLNLRGLIYYIKGDLEGARNQWKINYKLNDDEIARKYLNDSRSDRDRLKSFREGQKLLKEIKVKEALDIFESLKESHFNFINLYNNIALCYVRLGEYDTAYYHIKQVLNFDNKNKNSYEIIKSLQEIGAIKHKNEVKRKNILITISAIVVFSLISFLAIYWLFNDENSSNNKQSESLKIEDKKNDNVQNNDTKQESKEETIKKETEDTEKEVVEKEETPKFPFESMKSYIEKKNYEEVLKILGQFNLENLSGNDKAMYIKGVQLINSEAVEIYYNRAQELMEKKDYKNSIDTLNKIYKYSDGNYLKEHIIYMMGVCYESQSDIVGAIKWYEEYVNKYKSGSYTESVLYKLAILNKDIDNKKSKQYANEIIKNYPNSQYNNSKIEDIIKS
ncbi:MAG: tetratricopeptide repeat protein [Clostridium sp.]